MRATIDSAGRLVIPKPLRQALQLANGTEVELRLQGGHIELEPVLLPVSIERKGRMSVARPREAVPPLTAAEVRATQALLRGEDE